MSWNSIVYAVNEEMIDMDDWKKIMRPILKRDKYRCQSCEKRFKVEYLSAHHIKARKDGGDNSPENLITLCVDCHNEIEPLGLNKTAIRGYKVGIKLKKIVGEKPSSDEVTWQQIVYGGRKRV